MAVCGVMYHCMHVLFNVRQEVEKNHPYLIAATLGHQSALASTLLTAPTPTPVPSCASYPHAVNPSSQRFLEGLSRRLPTRRSSTRQKY